MWIQYDKKSSKIPFMNMYKQKCPLQISVQNFSSRNETFENVHSNVVILNKL